MNPSCASSGPVVISETFAGVVWHWCPAEFVHAWNSISTMAVFAPVYSPVMFATTHFKLECPAVGTTGEEPDPVNVCFSVCVTGIHSYFPRPGAAADRHAAPV